VWFPECIVGQVAFKKPFQKAIEGFLRIIEASFGKAGKLGIEKFVQLHWTLNVSFIASDGKSITQFDPITEAFYETDAALREALFGNASTARQRAIAALGLSNSRDVEYGVAFALAVLGDSARSQALTDDLSRRFPEDTKVRFTFTPTLHALLALNHNEPSKAVELLQTAIPYEDGIVSSGGSEQLYGAGNLYPAYVRGEAYLTAHQGREAAVEFQKILDHRGIVISDPIGALAHLQLGRAYVLTADKDKACIAYKDFLTFWKDADPDIPILKKAKAEYAKLQ
jgi:hypothetical protein